ncbi:hypothetical protein QYF61_014942 [Mycteria americana]|uniref:Uncharacterized protein n=1 Tax=Mycteria americana TaxID=33587 RepID=A0AAN7MP26_MYCAM|nr:hypothetical protein QYF61_014942 [Mycteria americana]
MSRKCDDNFACLGIIGAARWLRGARAEVDEGSEKVLCGLPLEVDECLRWEEHLRAEEQRLPMSRKRHGNFACLGIVGATSDENHSVRLWNQHGAGEVPRLGGVSPCTDKGSLKARCGMKRPGGYYKANEALTCSVDGGRAADIVYLDCSEAFDSFPQLPSGILLCSGVDNWLFGSMGKWVTGHHPQRMVANSSL